MRTVRPKGVSAMQKTILYIEDDPASRSLVERTLRYGGYRVLIAENGLDGIDIARSEIPDLILTDINLPDMSGREVTTTLRGDPRFSATPIVALTAHAMEGDERKCLEAGCDDFVNKPIPQPDLAALIARYVRDRSSDGRPERAA